MADNTETSTPTASDITAEAKKQGFFGLRNVHVAFAKTETTWEDQIALPGAISLKMSAEDSDETAFGDDAPFAKLYTRNGFTGEIVLYGIPDDILAKMLGYRVDSNGGVVGLTDVQPTPFALTAENQSTIGDPVRVVYYNCTISRPDDESETKEDKVSLKQYTYKITALPIEVNGERMDHYRLQRSTANKAVFDSMLTKVVLPDATAA